VPQTVNPPSTRLTGSVAVVSKSTKTITPLGITPVVAPSTQAINDLVALASKGQQVRDVGDLRYLLNPGHTIRHQCCARLVPGMVRLKLYNFRDQWRAKLRERKGEERFLFHVPLPVSLWQRMMGKLPVLALEMRCAFPQNENTALAELEVEIWPQNCGEPQAENILETVGPRLLESLWGCLNATPERRGHLRIPFQQTVQIAPLPEGSGEKFQATTRDVSLLGMSLVMSSRLSAQQVCVWVSLPSQPEPTPIKARVVHVRERKEGGFEIGLSFT
jgi:hypothetical protein